MLMRWSAVTAASLALAVGACTAEPPTPTSTPTPPSAGITPLLATTELRLGTQRVAFVLESPTALVTAAEAEVTTTPPGSDGFGETALATFHLWPFGTRGSYATELTFDVPGTWRLDIHVDDGAFVGDTSLDVHVSVRSSVRDIGELAPFSNTKTLRSEGGDLARLSTSSSPDPELYRLTVAEALISGRPSLIVFASPAFCTSPTCGPQVETVSELRQRQAVDADFIHVEVYDNPHEIQGDLSRGVYAPALATWGIDTIPGYLNESWVFVLGRDGRIAARFEGYASLAELEAALLAAA